FVVLLASSMTVNEIGLRAHDEDDSSVMHNDGMEDREVISEANEMKDEVATEDKEKTSDIDDQKEIEESHKENSDKKTTPKKKKPPKELSELKVHFIDVGQADAALVEYADKAILIDAGDWNKNDVLPYLQQIGIKKLNLIVGTHE